MLQPEARDHLPIAYPYKAKPSHDLFPQPVSLSVSLTFYPPPPLTRSILISTLRTLKNTKSTKNNRTKKTTYASTMPTPPTSTLASASASALPQTPTSSSPLAPPHHLTWTEEKEERLRYVRRQLRDAQRKWSEEQELWIDEVSCFCLFCWEGGREIQGPDPDIVDGGRAVSSWDDFAPTITSSPVSINHLLDPLSHKYHPSLPSTHPSLTILSILHPSILQISPLFVSFMAIG